MFWETLPGLVASWAAAAAGVAYLVRLVWRGVRLTRRISVSVARLIEIGDEDEWPNGSKTLPQSIVEIYKRQSQTHDLLEAYIVSHRQDHELLN